MNMKLAICTYATKGYLHAWRATLMGISSAAGHHEDVMFIFATDTSKEGEMAFEEAKSILPEGWRMHCIEIVVGNDDSEEYKIDSQIRIAKLQGEAFAFAKRIRADKCWSVESDTIPTAESLRVLEWALDMPTADGVPYYDIAAATYPNKAFLGGFGSPERHIEDDFLPHERKVPKWLKKGLIKCEEQLNDDNTHKRAVKLLRKIHERIRKCPPDGNVFEVNGKYGWRRRGWLENAYPGIGRGSIVPSDWCGMGCTLMSRKALALADFAGYEGVGTQDLFLCWERWNPAGLRIACVPHIACDHIKKREDHIEHMVAYHETHGEYIGHLRVRSVKLSVDNSQ